MMTITIETYDINNVSVLSANLDFCTRHHQTFVKILKKGKCNVVIS